MLVHARDIAPPGRPWKPFRFKGLEKVSRGEAQLVQKLQWLIPGDAPAAAAQAILERLRALVESEVHFALDDLRMARLQDLRRLGDAPTFIAVLSAGPQVGRALLEVELGLAHSVVDLLLGGAGETVGLRPLTDIEEGVLSYGVLEVLRGLSPSLEPGLARLQLETVTGSMTEALARLGEEVPLVALQYKGRVGQHAGTARLLVPLDVLDRSEPAPRSPAALARIRADLEANRGRLAAVRTWLRAEIGHAEIAAEDLASLREKDVVLMDALSARPDHGSEGTAELRVGLGNAGVLDADVFLEEGTYRARITDIRVGSGGFWASEELPDPEDAAENIDPGAERPPEALESEAVEEGAKRDGSDLLTDIPLQIAVELARVQVGADEVVGLRVGQVLDLQRGPGEPVELSVNGKVIARGELVEIEGQLGVRVLSLAE